MPFEAVKLIGYVPAVPATGVPESTPVAALNVTPPGSAPVSLSVEAGKPVAVTVKLPADPTVNVVLFALVIAGAWFTVRVNDRFAVPAPFAVKVIGYVPPVP